MLHVCHTNIFRIIKDILKLDNNNTKPSFYIFKISFIKEKRKKKYIQTYLNLSEKATTADQIKHNICQKTSCDDPQDVWEDSLWTVKHSGGSVVIWGCFVASGPEQPTITDATMDSAFYQKFPKDNVQPLVLSWSLSYTAGNWFKTHQQDHLWMAQKNKSKTKMKVLD